MYLLPFLLFCCLFFASTMSSSSNNQKLIQEFCVADQELHTGNQKGKVFLRFSSESVGFLTDRSVVQARVMRKLHAFIEKEVSSKQQQK
jgi:hypothetical protein